MASPLQPEFFVLLGVDLFLAMSLLICLLERHFPWQLPYLYQFVALAGFGQLLVSKEFIAFFGEYTRFWYSLFYLIVALANIVAVNLYLGIVKRLLNYAGVFMFTVTFPALSLAVFFLSNYAEVAVHPLIMSSQMFWETTFVAIGAFGTFVVGLGTYIFFKPKLWYIAVGAGAMVTGASIYALYKPTWGEAVFIVPSTAVAIACALASIWIDVLKERKRMEVKQ